MVIFNAPANHRNAGTVVLSSGLSINLAGILNNTWGPKTRIGTVSLSTSAIAELKVGTSNPLAGRHTLIAQNASSKLFYIKNTTTLSSSDGLLIDSGTVATINLNPQKVQHIYGLAYAGTPSVTVVEIKSST